MGRAKDIIVKIVPAAIANDFVKKHHYSGKSCTTSIVHFGAFLDNKLHGIMSFGNPIDKRKVLPLVKNTGWNEMLELNRMAFDDYLPRNSESRCFSIAIKLLKKNAPHIKWILSFSDGTQCGDGTIYRASGFQLTAIRKSTSDLWELPLHLKQYNDGKNVAHRMTCQGKSCRLGAWVLSKYGTNNVSLEKLQKDNGGKLMDGFQLRYIYLIDKSCKITVPILPFEQIDKLGAGMYKGKKVSLHDRKKALEVHAVEHLAPSQEVGGSNPTPALQNREKTEDNAE